MNFFDLPREIRDDIYNYTFPFRSPLWWSTFSERAATSYPGQLCLRLKAASTQQSPFKTLSNRVSILRASKRTREEVLSMLYTYGVFQINFKSLDSLPGSFYSTQASELMRHVEITIDYKDYNTFRPYTVDLTRDKRLETIINRLATLQDHRSTCRILLDCNKSEIELHKSMLCKELRKLKHLDTLILQFCYTPTTFRRVIRGTNIRPAELRCDELRYKVADALEAHLGPAKYYESHAHTAPSMKHPLWRVYRCVEFNPRNHWAERHKEAGPQGMEHNLSRDDGSWELARKNAGSFGCSVAYTL